MDWSPIIEPMTRAWGSGSVYQRKGDGRWVVAVRGPGGRRVRYFRSEPSQTQVRAALREMGSEIAPQTKLTVGRWLATWLDSMRPPRVRPSTWVSYELHVRHLADLAAIPLARLTPADVRLHLRAMSDDGHAPRSVAYSLSILRMALRAAERDRIVSRNVALAVDPPRAPRVEPVILTTAQTRALIAEGDPLWTLLVTTGLRLGEALALRSQDIDVERRTITVTAGLRPVPRRFRGTGPRLQRVDPKTSAGRRTVALPVPIAWPEPDPPNIDGLVFTSPTGAPRDPRTVSREWTETRLRLGIGPEVTIHALRHTAVSLALASGATLDDVKRMVGHSTIAMTSDTYGHLVEGRSREVADRLAVRLATSGAPRT